MRLAAFYAAYFGAMGGMLPFWPAWLAARGASDAEIGILQLNQPGGEWTKGYRLGYYVQIRDVMYKHFDDIFAGNASVDDAFAAIEEESNQLLERFHATYQ